MKKEDCFLFGRIIRTHGLDGGLSIHIDADEPLNYAELPMFFLEIHKQLIPFFIQSIKIQKDKATIKLEDVHDIEAASALTGKDIFLPLELLPELTGNKFYYHEIINFTIIDEEFGTIGELANVLEYPNQTLMQIFHDSKEVLIPIIDELIIKVDRQNKQIIVRAPEGLIDLYLQ